MNRPPLPIPPFYDFGITLKTPAELKNLWIDWFPETTPAMQAIKKPSWERLKNLGMVLEHAAETPEEKWIGEALVAAAVQLRKPPGPKPHKLKTKIEPWEFCPFCWRYPRRQNARCSIHADSRGAEYRRARRELAMMEKHGINAGQRYRDLKDKLRPIATETLMEDIEKHLPSVAKQLKDAGWKGGIKGALAILDDQEQTAASVALHQELAANPDLIRRMLFRAEEILSRPKNPNWGGKRDSAGRPRKAG